ncbi:MAG: Ldh family oxidoreductase [Gammaproteobacteria bacterium]|nr:Ldh family oxidoreductase [Gammaproteobacteria bacterium]
MPDTEHLTLEQIHALARACLMDNGCDQANADAVASTVTHAERDGSVSHGLFRIPGYVAALRSGKVDGAAAPRTERLSPALIRVDGGGGFAPRALQHGIPLVAQAAEQCGVAALALVRVHHFAALWHETEALAARGLAALACTAYMPAVAPAGARRALFGTNPVSFAWPRPDDTPVVFDMATASMAMGEVQIAARDGHQVPPGTGLNAAGEATTDPASIADGGVLLPFGGYKGSVISMMIELLAAALIGERFSFEAAEADNQDGGPPRGGEFILALSPQRMAGDDWAGHAAGLFERLGQLDGARLPGQRRHTRRHDRGARAVNAALVEKIRGLCK